MTRCFCCGKEIDKSIKARLKKEVIEVSDPLRKTGSRGSCFLCWDCCKIVGVKGTMNTFTKKKCIKIYEEKTGNQAFDMRSINPSYDTASINNTTNDRIVYDVMGVRGRNLKVYDNKCVITVKANVGSFLTGNVSDGQKTIFYSDVVGVQFKKSGLQIGYLQLETSSGIMNNKNSNFFNENSFTFDTTTVKNESMEEVVNYIKSRIEEYKNTSPSQQSNYSALDEVKKLKDLLDMGAITQEEFDIKKKELLGL